MASYHFQCSEMFELFSTNVSLWYFLQVDEENGLVLSTIVRNHFRSINIVRGVTKSKSPHRQSLIM